MVSMIWHAKSCQHYFFFEFSCAKFSPLVYISCSLQVQTFKANNAQLPSLWITCQPCLKPSNRISHTIVLCLSLSSVISNSDRTGERFTSKSSRFNTACKSNGQLSSLLSLRELIRVTISLSHDDWLMYWWRVWQTNWT